jgi:hypothetical protein
LLGLLILGLSIAGFVMVRAKLGKSAVAATSEEVEEDSVRHQHSESSQTGSLVAEEAKSLSPNIADDDLAADVMEKGSELVETGEENAVSSDQTPKTLSGKVNRRKIFRAAALGGGVALGLAASGYAAAASGYATGYTLCTLHRATSNARSKNGGFHRNKTISCGRQSHSGTNHKRNKSTWNQDFVGNGGLHRNSSTSYGRHSGTNQSDAE